MRPRPDDGGLPRGRLVRRRLCGGPHGDLRVAHRGRQAGRPSALPAGRQRGQQEEGREVTVRRSKSLVPTLREDPADAEALSHRLMLRAGLVRQLAAGIYVYLPLGQRVLAQVNPTLREELNALDGPAYRTPVL